MSRPGSRVFQAYKTFKPKKGLNEKNFDTLTDRKAGVTVVESMKGICVVVSSHK